MAHRTLVLTVRRVVIPVTVILIVLMLTAPRTAPGGAPRGVGTAVWPDAKTTGVPAGISLKPSAGLTVRTDGAVISGLDIHGCVDVLADNVTIRDTRIRDGSCAFAQVAIGAGATGTLIEDSEIDGQGRTELSNDGTGICCGGYSARRLNIHGNVNGAVAGTALPTMIEDSWIHDLHQAADSHNQDILTNGGSAGIVIRHNRLDNQLSEVGVIDLFADVSAVQNVAIEDNLLNGGGYVIYGGCDPLKKFGSLCERIAITGNHFMRRPQPGAFNVRGGYYGPVTSFNGLPVPVTRDQTPFRALHGLTWSGNVWDNDGSVILL